MNENKKKSLISIRKAITSLKKIEEMIEKDEYCGDIIVQNMAAI
jgi:DNA-binding FrmR family transcriptional regulator